MGKGEKKKRLMEKHDDKFGVPENSLVVQKSYEIDGKETMYR